MQRLRGRLGLPKSATPHALRHSFATHTCWAPGWTDLRSIQELLGQRIAVGTTQKYAAVDAEAACSKPTPEAHPRA